MVQANEKAVNDTHKALQSVATAGMLVQQKMMDAATTAMTSMAQDYATSQPIIAGAIEKVKAAEKFLLEQKYAEVTKSDSKEAQQAEAALTTAQSELTATFQKFAVGSLSAQDAFVEAYNVGVNALKQMGLYNASAAELAQWATKARIRSQTLPLITEPEPDQL